MAVSHHKTSNIINCSGCHLPFNFNNSVPKSLPCKHWFCLACLEDMISKSDDFAHFECVNCQQTIDVHGLNKTLETLPQPTTTTSTTTTTATTTQNADLESQRSITRSASITSDNSMGCSLYFNTNSNNTNGNGIGNGNGTTHNLNIFGGNHQQQRNETSSMKMSSFEQMSPGENCIIHGMPNTLWCNTCDMALCRGCNSGLDHKEHLVQNHHEAKECYTNKLQREIMDLQNSLGDMEQLNRMQKEFLLNILEGCCALKTHLETELASQTQSLQIDAMKEMLRKLQMHLEMLQEHNPNDFVKLDRVVKDEKQKFRIKHKELLRHYAVNEVISTNERLLDFQMIQQIFQRPEQNDYHGQVIKKPSSHNPILHLTNYCIYHLYVSYTKQKQQFFEDQLWRYQQYQQQIIANFKTHHNHHQQQQQQHTSPPPVYNNNNNNNVNNINNNNNNNNNNNIKTICSTSIYDQLQYKRKTYAEIANSTAKCSMETSQPTAGGGGDAFDLFNGPLTVTQYKQLEEVGKCIDLLLLNPISNDNNHIYYFDFERNGDFLGRVLIKVYASYAPKMSYNFHALCTNEKGMGYRGCRVFKCYPNQSIITGDIDQNNGYGSRSIYEEPQFVPDDTKIPPFIGAVGMRRAKKIYDSQCLVGSQFRIILKVRPFSAIFGRVIEGLEVVWNISQMQAQNEKLNGNMGGGGGALNGGGNAGGGGGAGSGGGGITVAQCGVYEFVKRHLSAL